MKFAQLREPSVASVVPNFTLMGPYLRVLTLKNTKIAKFANSVASQGRFYCSISVKFMWFMQDSLSYKCFKFSIRPTQAVIALVFAPQARHVDGYYSEMLHIRRDLGCFYL